jgi:hypothetical protein
VNVSQISAHYMRRWFLIDFVSCLPVGYISYFSADGTIGDQFKAAKVLRLFRLAKMLRLARVLRILRKYEEKINLVSTKRFLDIGLHDLSNECRARNDLTNAIDHRYCYQLSLSNVAILFKYGLLRCQVNRRVLVHFCLTLRP